MLKMFFGGVALGLLFTLIIAPKPLQSALPIHAPDVAPQPVTILAFGDLMLDRVVRQDIDAYGPMYPFEKIAPVLAGHDIIVGNAEGIFSDEQSVSVENHDELDFTFATSTLSTLKALGFTALSEANNHALNFGWDVLHQSQQWMHENGIDTFGDPENQNPGPLYETVRGMKVAFVGYDEFSSDGGSDAGVLQAIAIAHKAGAFTIVYPHWGEEYDDATTPLQQSEAYKFIDAGADAVLGSHPHVVEPIEIYKNKAIFYSMGNFIFDQSFSDDVMYGIGVEISLTASTATYVLVPFTIEHAQATPQAPESLFTLPR